MGLLSTVFLYPFLGKLNWKGSVVSMKVIENEMITLKYEMVTTMEDYINEFGKIRFYTRNGRREYCI